MVETSFSRLVGCRRPLQLAGMPGVVTPALAIAVAEEGALAMIPAAGLPPAVLGDTIAEVASATRAPLGVNFLVPFLDREALAVAASRVRVVEFFYGAPDPDVVGVAHRGGALVSWQVGSADEAAAAEAAGCDLVVAQGIEAGGHVRGGVGLFPLLASVLERVKVPVVAAGGIGCARTMAAALAAGASAARVGTRFVASRESAAHPGYVAALVAAKAEDTVLTECFSFAWPDAPHRVLRSCVDAATALADEIAGHREVGGQRLPIPRLAPPPPDRGTTGRVDAMALYAGHSVDSVRGIEPAASIVRELCDGAAALLQAAGRSA